MQWRVLVKLKDKNRCWYLGSGVGYLANSCTELCQGRQGGYVVWLGVPMYYCPRKEGEFVEVF